MLRMLRPTPLEVCIGAASKPIDQVYCS